MSDLALPLLTFLGGHFDWWKAGIQGAVLGNTLLEVAGVVLPLLSSLLILYSRELILYSIFYSETRYSTRILLKSIEIF